MRRVVTLLSVRRAARCYPGRGRGSAAADVLAPDQGVALLELAHGGRAARVIEQHDVHALASQEAEGAFVRAGVGAMAGDTPWRVVDRLTDQAQGLAARVHELEREAPGGSPTPS